MARDPYIIVRVNYQLMPAAVDYVGHGETPHDLKLIFLHFRDSATQYSNKRDAIREARRLSSTFTRYRFKVVGYRGRNVLLQLRAGRKVED